MEVVKNNESSLFIQIIFFYQKIDIFCFKMFISSVMKFFTKTVVKISIELCFSTKRIHIVKNPDN